MSESVLIETSGPDPDLRTTAVSDVPIEELAADVPAPGTVLDERYEITGILGQGGMGHVLSARHVVLGHRVAIKVLRREMTRDAEIVERFRREARAASAIGHTGIAAVKDFGVLASGASYYVMEHVDGVSLSDALHEAGRFPIARAVDVVRQIADALGAAHAAGIVHRDVKPENVLLTAFHGRPDHVKILDFGIAKLDFASRLSGAHRVLGTPAYMSPEQTRGQALDHRSDVYALGILFYELLVGDVPFDDPRPLEVLRQQIATPAPPVQASRADVPDAIATLIARCLEKSVDARPASMKEIVAELAAFQPAPPASTPTPAPAPPSPPSPALAYAATSLSLTPVPAWSRPTPIAPIVPEVPVATRARGSRLVMVAGISLTVMGVAALAAAGGILMRERSDERASVNAPIAPAVVEAPVIAAAAPPVALPTASSPAPTLAPPSPPPRATHPAHVARPTHPHATPAPEVAPAPATTPAPRDAHPAIRVIDPWGDGEP